MDDAVDEVEFGDAGGVEDEGVEVGLAHAAGDFVEDGGEADPGVEGMEEGFAVGGGFGLEEDFGGEGMDAQGDAGGVQAEVHDGIEGGPDMEVMGPGLGPILPGMGGGIGADVTGLPIFGGAVGVVVFEGGFVVGLFIAEDGAEGG